MRSLLSCSVPLLFVSCSFFGRAPCDAAVDCAATEVCGSGFCVVENGPADAGPDVVDVQDAGDLDAGEDVGAIDAGDDVAVDAGVDASVLDAGVDAGNEDAGVDAAIADAGVDAGPTLFYDEMFRLRVAVQIPALAGVDLEVPQLVRIPWDPILSDVSARAEDVRVFDANDDPLPFDLESFSPTSDIVAFVRLRRGAAQEIFFAFDPVAPLADGSTPLTTFDGFDVVWHFETLPAFDRMRTLRAASVGQPSLVDGIAGSSLALEATGDALVVLDDDLLDVLPLRSFTALVWFRLAAVDVGGGFHALFAKGGLDGSTPGYGLELDAFGTIQLEAQATDTGLGRVLIGSDPVVVDPTLWRHAAMVIDRDLDAFQIFIDGVLEGSLPLAGLGDFSNDLQMHIGAGRSTTSQPWFGGLDELWIAHRALSAEEIETIARGAADISSGPVEVAQ